MNILTTQYNLSRKALEIYVSGCKGPHCLNCHNPESWSFDRGDYYKDTMFRIDAKIRDFNTIIDKIEIYGGEPLDQDIGSLVDFLKRLKTFDRDIWLFTRYALKEVPNNVKMYCDYIKCGRYLEDLKTENNMQYGIKLATSNQIIYKKGVDY